MKFNDADLLGCPVRLTVGERGLAEGAVELKERACSGKGELVKLDAVVERCTALLRG